MKRAGLRFWAGAEYKPKEENWSQDEWDAGLERVLRIILQDDIPAVPDKVLDALAQIPAIARVEKGHVGRVKIPRTEAMSLQRNASDWAGKLIGLPAAHQITQGDPRVVVAVLDSGVDMRHPELAGNLVPGYDFVDILSGAEDFFGDKDGPDADPDDELVGHGTHVAGIIGAKGMRVPKGVAPQCKIMPVRVLGAVKGGGGYVGAGLVDNINNGIKWAVDNGAHVINMSLGIKREGSGLPHEEAIQYAEAKGVTVIAASGNDGTPELYYPGALPYVISVGAVAANREVTSFTTYGRVVCAAPGQAIYSGHVGQSYAFASGTSQASPFVAGAAALLYSRALQLGRKITPAHVRHILKHTADKTGTQLRSQKEGYGILNVPDALRLLEYKLENSRKI